MQATTKTIRMNSKTTESVMAFITGDALTTIMAFILFKDVALPMILAIGTGLLGGFFALLGKDLYKFIKKKYFGKGA